VRAIRKSVEEVQSILGGGARFDNGSWKAPGYSIRNTRYSDVGAAFGTVDTDLGKLNTDVSRLNTDTDANRKSVQRALFAGRRARMRKAMRSRIHLSLLPMARPRMTRAVSRR